MTTNLNKYDFYDTEELLDIASDFSNDCYGYRMYSETREQAQEIIKNCHAYLDALTPEHRMAEGWV